MIKLLHIGYVKKTPYSMIFVFWN